MQALCNRQTRCSTLVVVSTGNSISLFRLLNRQNLVAGDEFDAAGNEALQNLDSILCAAIINPNPCVSARAFLMLSAFS